MRRLKDRLDRRKMGYVSALMKTIVPILSIAVDAYFIGINKRFKPQKIKKKTFRHLFMVQTGLEFSNGSSFLIIGSF